MKKITPFLWFNGQAEEAISFYTSIFPDSKVSRVSRQGPGGPVVSASFELAGQSFIALNGGPQYAFTPAISFLVNCESQEEIDTLWAKLGDGGEPGRCGWLRDRFGLSWQVVPALLGELIGGPTPAKAQAAVAAMMRMGKLDIAELRRAHSEA